MCVLANECSFDFLGISDRNWKMQMREYPFEKSTLTREQPSNLQPSVCEMKIRCWFVLKLGLHWLTVKYVSKIINFEKEYGEYWMLWEIELFPIKCNYLKCGFLTSLGPEWWLSFTLTNIRDWPEMRSLRGQSPGTASNHLLENVVLGYGRTYIYYTPNMAALARRLCWYRWPLCLFA